MKKFDKSWFELADIRRRSYNDAVWIPVYGYKHFHKEYDFPDVGHSEDFISIGSAVIFNESRDKADNLDYNDFMQDDTAPYFDNEGTYHCADEFAGWNEIELGYRFVLTQYVNPLHPRTVNIHQDFIYAYNLVEENGLWVRPHDDYETIIRSSKNEAGEIDFIEVRKEYLIDYLAAKDCSLKLYYYRVRQAVFAEDPMFDWPEDRILSDQQHDRCEVSRFEIDESGQRPNLTWGLFKAWRTDIDEEADVPDFSSEDDVNTKTESTSGTHQSSEIRYRVMGELWRGEWIKPADETCRIGNSEPNENILVSIDGSGKKVDLSTLNYEEIGKYLWFKPIVINDLLSRRGAELTWYSENTGSIANSSGNSIHFGVNSIGLINAYAYDIAKRRLWERQVWASSNCKPDGGVSAELMNAQMKCEPAETHAPENLLKDALLWINDCFEEKFNCSLINLDIDTSNLSKQIHRFRGSDEAALHNLAKDIVKYSIERLNKKSLLSALSLNKSDLRTLKLLEALIAQHTSEKYAKKLLGPIHGIYNLRIADAHLKVSDMEESYKLIGIDKTDPLILQSASLIRSAANVFGVAGAELKQHA